MCGIAGYIGKRHNEVENIFQKNLLHRGPDFQQKWQREDVLLFHARLKIIDISDAANQPMTSHCGRYVMVYNGEVYNFKDIKKEIEEARPDMVFRSSSDSEVILEAFAIWGAAMVEKMNGMFAIAIYDISEEKLFLFRDRLGEKPLYYFGGDGIFAFASELGPLASLPINHGGYCKQAVFSYLNLGFIPEPLSIWENIKKFPKASYGVFGKDGLKITKYWDAAEKASLRKRKLSEETEKAFEFLLEESVKMRLISDVPLGLLLSGGTDSSLVSAIAQKGLASSLKTFNIGFEDRSKDESEWAKKVAKHIGTDHHTIIFTEKEALDLIPDIINCYDEPFSDSSALPTMLVSELARRHVTVALTGDGGDEQFLGYGSHLWAERLASKGLRIFRHPLACALNMGSSRYKRIAAMLRYQKSDDLYTHILSQEQFTFSYSEVARISGLHMPTAHFTVLNKDLRPAENQALNDLLLYLPDDLLVKTDRASMRYSLELRAPLLDHRLVEYSLSLPYEAKINNGTAKYLLKKILAKHIPKDLVYRRKQGFSVPLEKWLRNDLMPMAEHYLSTREIQRYGLLDPKEVTRILSSFYNKDYHFYYIRIWQLMVLQMFLEKNGN